MVTMYPTREELENRIRRHLGWRNTGEVVLIWNGYLNALLEWGLIDVDCHAHLQNLLPKVGGVALYEQMLDEPANKEIQEKIAVIEAKQ